MAKKTSFYPSIQSYIETLPEEHDSIPAERKDRLAEMASYIKVKLDAGEVAEMIYICTHNSRRSHFAQIWAHVLAVYHGIEGVHAYSGGTESTAFHPNAIETLQQLGFDIAHVGRENNPRYQLRFSDEAEPIKAWSKMYTDPENPRKNFCAVMVCDDADKNCPLVFGSKKRFSLSFRDPKEADGTPQQAQAYAERCRQIAVQINYLYSLIP